MGTKIPCLTIWRYPKIAFLFLKNIWKLIIGCRFIRCLSDVYLLNVICITIIYLYNDIHSSYISPFCLYILYIWVFLFLKIFRWLSRRAREVQYRPPGWSLVRSVLWFVFVVKYELSHISATFQPSLLFLSLITG